jgi:hypothetical protein
LRSDPATTTTPLPSHAIASTAANAIANISAVYEQTYGLQQATPFMIYYVFTAAIMHVTNSRWPAEAEQAKAGLGKCLKALEAMRVMWGGAARQMELLMGLVDFSKQEPELPPGPTAMFAAAGGSNSPNRGPVARLPSTSKGLAVSDDAFHAMPDVYRPTPNAVPSHFPLANIPASVQAPQALDVMYDDWLNSFLGPQHGESLMQHPMAASPLPPLTGFAAPDPALYSSLFMPMEPPEDSMEGIQVLSRAALGQSTQPQTTDFMMKAL